MTTDDIMALANKYAASNGKALLEKLYGTSQSYTEQCATEAFQDRQSIREAINKLVTQRDELLAALRGMLAIVNDSRGVAGYHLNGNTAEWDEFDEVDAARAAIAKVEGGAA